MPAATLERRLQTPPIETTLPQPYQLFELIEISPRRQLFRIPVGENGFGSYMVEYKPKHNGDDIPPDSIDYSDVYKYLSRLGKLTFDGDSPLHKFSNSVFSNYVESFGAILVNSPKVKSPTGVFLDIGFKKNRATTLGVTDVVILYGGHILLIELYQLNNRKRKERERRRRKRKQVSAHAEILSKKLQKKFGVKIPISSFVAAYMVKDKDLAWFSINQPEEEIDRLLPEEDFTPEELAA